MVNTRSHTPRATEATPLRRWSGRVGSLALAGLGIAHLVINSIGFAREPGADWPLFAVFGIGISLLAAGLAMVTWRDADRLHGGTWARVLVGLAGLVCGYNVVTVLRLHPELILSPVGPGLWSVVGAPALLLAALLPRRPLTR